jgi:DNA recombination protein RmuC
MSSSFFIGFLSGGIVFGAIAGFFITLYLKQQWQGRLTLQASTSEQGLNQQKLMYEQQLVQQREILGERIKDHELHGEKLKDQFTLLAQDVLTKNLETQIKALANQNTHDLDKKKQEFTQSFDEIRKSLKTTGDQISMFEKERTDQYAKIEKQIQTISLQEEKLIQETERLKSALTTSQSVRGRWGELVLRNILEQSDLVQGIDFEEQAVSSDGDGNVLKPDFVIKLPQSGQHLVIDSKASIFDSYLESEQVSTEASRKALHVDFARRLRLRVSELSSKEYQNFVSRSLPYVVLFVPSEAAIRAAFDVDQDLFKWAMDRKVFLSSPATILPLIMLIAHGWKQHRLSEKAAELSQVVSTLGQRLDLFMKRLGRVQSGLETASRAWNEAIDKSWNGTQSIQKSIEKARELGGNLNETEPLASLENTLRNASSEIPVLLNSPMEEESSEAVGAPSTESAPENKMETAEDIARSLVKKNRKGKDSADASQEALKGI